MTIVSLLETILPYISGLWTLPWIIVGIVVSYLLAKPFGQERINKAMKKIGLILLFVFIPLLMFRLFLNITFGRKELIFTGITFVVLSFMYLLAYFLGHLESKNLELKGMKKRIFLKTVLTNQGRSAAFVGGALLAIEAWAIPAAIYIAFVGVGLFGVIPYVLSVMHKHERKNNLKKESSLLPWYLKLYPWYLLSFIVAAIIVHHRTRIDIAALGDGGTVLHFITALTIPAALYYVGSGIHPTDLKLDEIKKMVLPQKNEEKRDFDWAVGRNAFFTTMVYTPIILAVVFTPLMLLEIIPRPWFAVIVINSILPITSTNMFLLPYGLNPKGTALSITWTTVISVPLVLILIPLLSTIL